MPCARCVCRRADIRCEHRRVRLEAGVGQPVQVGGRLGGPLRVAELGPVDDAVDDGGAVGREDHVGQARDRLDLLNRVPEAAVRVAQPLPLPNGEVTSTGAVGSIHGLIA